MREKKPVLGMRSLGKVVLAHDGGRITVDTVFSLLGARDKKGQFTTVINAPQAITAKTHHAHFAHGFSPEYSPKSASCLNSPHTNCLNTKTSQITRKTQPKR